MVLLIYSSENLRLSDGDEALLTTVAAALSTNNMHSLSRRTRSIKGDGHLGTLAFEDGYHRPSSIDGR